MNNTVFRFQKGLKMLEFKDFKILTNDSPISSIRFKFRDDELKEESIGHVNEEIKKYHIYLGYDSQGEFSIKYKKRAEIEIIVTFPQRKVPQEKKKLENFINKFVMDFSEYYSKINYLEDFEKNDLIEIT